MPGALPVQLQLPRPPAAAPLRQHIPVGGTPTAQSLQLALGLPELADEAVDRAVVPVSDGASNCNPAIGYLDLDATPTAAPPRGSRGVHLHRHRGPGVDGVRRGDRRSATATSRASAGRTASRSSSASPPPATPRPRRSRSPVASRAAPSGSTRRPRGAVELSGQPLEVASFTVAGARVSLGPDACQRYRAGEPLALYRWAPPASRKPPGKLRSCGTSTA